MSVVSTPATATLAAADRGDRTPRQRIRLLAAVVCLPAVAFVLWRAHFLHVQSDYNHLYVLLTNTFETWDRAPLSRHWLQAFYQPDALERHRSYDHIYTVWLVGLYVLLKPLRWLGWTYMQAQRTLVVLHFGFVAALLYATAAPLERRRDWTQPAALVWFVVMLLAICGVATLSEFWGAAAINQPESWYDVPVLAFAYAAAVDFGRRGDAHLDQRIVWALFITVVIAPVYTPIVVLAVMGLWLPRTSGIRRHSAWLRPVLALTAIGAISFALPIVLSRFAGLTPDGSPFLWRSGLDGDMTYMTSVGQAIWRTFDPAWRKWSLLPFPIAAAAFAITTAIWNRPLAARMARQLFIAWLPYAYMVILLPQLVAIHPYVFDFGIVFSAAFTLTSWLLQPAVEATFAPRRAAVLAIGMALVALVMTNVLDLSRLR